MAESLSQPSQLERSRPVRRRRVLFALAAMVIGCGLAMVAAEFVLRVYLACRGWTPNCYAASVDLFQPDAGAGCTLKRNFRLRSSQWQMSTNSIGLRGPELRTPRTPGCVRIAILGGSSAFGYLVNDGHEAARLLEANLRNARCDVEVLNAGVPGYNLYQSRVRFREIVAPQQPDIVVCYAGWNDLGYVVSESPGDPDHRLRPVHTAWQRAAAGSVLYSLIVHRLLATPADLPRARLPSRNVTDQGDRQFRENFGALIDDIKSVGAVPVICIQATTARPDVAPELRRYLGETPAEQDELIALGGWLRETLTTESTRRSLVCVDAGQSIGPTPDNLLDNVHLSVAGEAQLADLLTQTLLPLIRTRR